MRTAAWACAHALPPYPTALAYASTLVLSLTPSLTQRLTVRIHEIVIYTDFKLDESYTPSKISIRVGSTFHDLQEIHVEELNEPSGWVTILPPREETAEGGVLRTHFIQVAVLANHQNGRDTHIRQIKICARARRANCREARAALSRAQRRARAPRGRYAAPPPRAAHVPTGVLLDCLPAVRLHSVTRRPLEESSRM